MPFCSMSCSRMRSRRSSKVAARAGLASMICATSQRVFCGAPGVIGVGPTTSLVSPVASASR